MKVEKIEKGLVSFKPITLEITFESAEELSILQKAENDLCRSDISEDHSYDNKNFWIDILENLAIAAHKKS